MQDILNDIKIDMCLELSRKQKEISENHKVTYNNLTGLWEDVLSKEFLDIDDKINEIYGSLSLKAQKEFTQLWYRERYNLPKINCKE